MENVDRDLFEDEEDYQGYLKFVEQIGKKRSENIQRVANASKNWKQFDEPKVVDLKYYQLLEGEGVRHTIYVSGCFFNCLNCYNKSIQIQSQGYTLTKDMEDEFLNRLDDPFVDGVTFVGGEPLTSAKLLIPMANRIRDEHPTKTIWTYTGYLAEDILDNKDSMQYELFALSDVVVDGQFITELRDETNLEPFRGSSNQRLIDVEQTLQQNKIVEYEL